MNRPRGHPASTLPLRVVAHGGGVQTTALLVLAAQGQIDYRTFLFANVGEDSERRSTLAYLHDVAAPYAKDNGLDLIELHRVKASGERETIYERITRPDTQSVVIPFRGENGMPLVRDCTPNFKIAVIGKWLKERGASPGTPATVAMGISKDEIHRANSLKANPYEVLAYPLLDLRMNRADCEQVIRGAGLPSPGKSACWFCPFTKPGQWADMQRRDPETFYRAAELEALVNDRQDAAGKRRVYLTRFGMPLTKAPIGTDQGVLFDAGDDDHCDNGWCMT